MSSEFPPCPASLRNVQHYLKTAAEHENRDIVVVYWCRLYSLQAALKIDKKSDEAKLLLVKLMDWLEKKKKELHENEAITNEVAAQAHIENYALKLFVWADNQDQNAVFNKNVVKSFYTAGMLMDILSVFGEVSEDIESKRKYAKWKAAYIHNCLKNGETPIPGPLIDDEAGGKDDFVAPVSSRDGSEFPSGSTYFRDPTNPSVPYTSENASDPSVNVPKSPVDSSKGHAPTPSFYSPAPSGPSPSPLSGTLPATPQSSQLLTPSGVKLDPAQVAKAQKYCKWANSALNYDDVPEAISNIQKALKLLTTGEDS